MSQSCAELQRTDDLAKLAQMIAVRCLKSQVTARRSRQGKAMQMSQNMHPQKLEQSASAAFEIGLVHASPCLCNYDTAADGLAVIASN